MNCVREESSLGLVFLLSIVFFQVFEIFLKDDIGFDELVGDFAYGDDAENNDYIFSSEDENNTEDDLSDEKTMLF